jgi:hemerythrin-like domain-containing protein
MRGLGMQKKKMVVRPYGPLMVEHRIIEQIVPLIRAEVRNIDKSKSIDPHFINVTVGFLRTYADKCHHGKEEDILFKALKEKELSKGHFETLRQLLEEHDLARSNVRELLDAKARYVKGDKTAVAEIRKRLLALAKIYPAHIALEDKHFFIEVMKYFSDKEQQKMVRDFWEFDRKMIHEEYREKVSRLKAELQ